MLAHSIIFKWQFDSLKQEIVRNIEVRYFLNKANKLFKGTIWEPTYIHTGDIFNEVNLFLSIPCELRHHAPAIPTQAPELADP